MIPGSARGAVMGALDLISPAFSLGKLVGRSGLKTLGVFYHIVDDAACPHVDHLYARRTVHAFEQELDLLLQHFRPISYQELQDAYLNSRFEELDKAVFHLTFDDGLRQMSEVVAPILRRKGVPATFFVNSAFVDNKQLFYRFKSSLLIDQLCSVANSSIEVNSKTDALLKAELLAINYLNQGKLDEIAAAHHIDFDRFLLDYQPFMTTEQVLQLQADGFEIGAHSYDHPRYNLLNEQQQLEQTERCLKELQLLLKQPMRTFAFPFTDDGVSLSFFKRLHTELQVELSFGGAGIKEDIFRNLQRFGPEQSPAPLEAQLKTEYCWYLLRRLFNRHHIQRK